MHDQADQLRELVRQSVRADGALVPGAPVIAVSGGQPGAGATTIACRLARELARLGKQVVLVDANLERPSAPKHFAASPLYCPPRSPDQARSGPHAANSPDQAWTGPHQDPSGLNGTLAEVLAGTRRAVEVLSPAHDGVRLLAGCPAGAAPPLDARAVQRFLAEIAALSRQVDVIVLDAGSGMNSWVDRLWQAARQILIVATPEPAALIDCYTAVKLSQFHRLDGKLRLTVNCCADPADAAPLARRFAETCLRFLFITPKQPVAIPAGRGRAGGDEDAFARAMRLLAADLAGDFHATSLRLPRASSSPSNATGDAMENSLPPLQRRVASRLPSEP